MDMYRSVYVMRAMRGVPSRRDVLRSLAGAGLGVGIVRFPDLAAAKKRKRKKRKKNKKVKPAQPNEFGCFEVGDPCRSEADCCSGICEGEKGKRKCRAHDGGTGCQAGLIEDGCGGDVDVDCTTSTGQLGICNTTTGNAGYCIGIGAASTVVPCKKDADCRQVCGTDAAACITCEGGTACVGPSSGDCNL